MKSVWRRVVSCMGAAALMTACSNPHTANDPTPTSSPSNIDIIALPHPDDEFQTWSLVEDTPETYKVFVLLTRGEQTGYCDDIKWTDECANRRIESWLGFFSDMAQFDDSLPGDLEQVKDVPVLDPGDTAIERVDDSAPYPASTQPLVYVDTAHRGALVIFDLGDGDLTAEEVTWALHEVIEKRDELGIDSELPLKNLIGAFWNVTLPNCMVYDHDDHKAVHVALEEGSFPVEKILAATCATDTRTTEDYSVSTASSDHVWSKNGTFAENYGWLGSNWILDSETQHELFMKNQTFWVRDVSNER